MLPIWLAWESFTLGNGTPSEAELVERIRAIRDDASAVSSTSPIGCRLLSGPVFFSPDLWVKAPRDWQRAIVAGKRYDLAEGEGIRMWRECLERAENIANIPSWVDEAVDAARYGRATTVRPRLGQGGFSLAVFDAYDRACCVTNEHFSPSP